MYRTHECRCDECRADNARRKRVSYRRRAFGRLTLVDAEEAREHVLALRRAGLTLRDIARRSDVTDRMLSALLYGNPSRGHPPTQRINRDANERILAVERPRVSSEASGWRRISAVGTHRRLQALARMGWSARAVARETGLHSGTLYSAMGRDMVRLSLAEDVAAAYRTLCMRSPVASTAKGAAAIELVKRRAREAGWASPMDWTPTTIDDPSAEPGQPV